MSTYILGTGPSHDGSACILKNGEIIVAIEKERLKRIKHDGANSYATATKLNTKSFPEMISWTCQINMYEQSVNNHE
ncbi:hypothetical protein [Mucilaginibacter paludis]|uniref:Uncharacterized protein n=1 Tax=Mucilaginibacter paludis DSM 18603 TaxID=714943 RepID=H1Y8A5_9SPHI|nr:hypothetical protein [Mucilaginibacter paludis]EHQ24924.1 hypothetical protein Mucpa_0743 [Mucilaginibacter paludis DSM 18603]